MLQLGPVPTSVLPATASWFASGSWLYPVPKFHEGLHVVATDYFSTHLTDRY